VTQHGSSPGRPRGRRARPDNDVPEWAGYDAVPQDQREFPDLAPIRPRDARVRDGRMQGDPGQGGWGQGSPVPGAPNAQGDWRTGGYPPTGPGYPQPGVGYQPGVPVGPGGPGVPGGPGQAGPFQPPQPPLGQPPQGQPPQGQYPQQQAQRPDWAGPDAVDASGEADHAGAFSERWRRRGSESREERRADRRKRRRLLFGVGGGALAVVIAVVAYFVTTGSNNTANLGFGSLVTTFLPGELQKVPNACQSVPGGTLTQYLPGQLKMAAPPLNTGPQSECTWTLDKPPVYRVLEVNMQAYSPSGLAPGDGSATFAAEYAYAQDESAKQDPGPKSGQPKAAITDLTGMPGGNDTVAFSAAQVFNVNGATTDVTTVYVRYRNVIVTVVMNGLDHANKGNYGPVSPSQLSVAAQTVANQVTGLLVH
jgi:hypothetical protein